MSRPDSPRPPDASRADPAAPRTSSSTVAFAAAAAVLVVTSTLGLLGEATPPTGAGWTLRGTLPPAPRLGARGD